jgi:hypothetical protein
MVPWLTGKKVDPAYAAAKTALERIGLGNGSNASLCTEWKKK